VGVARDVDDKVNQLLAEWYAHERGYRLGRGHNGISATTADHRTPGHFDWKNGATDAKVDLLIVRDVAAAIYSIPDSPQRWRTCTQREAHCLFWGVDNWAGVPVLPTGEELRILRIEARTKTIKEFRVRGLLD
jgi:hypothetical protein